MRTHSKTAAGLAGLVLGITTGLAPARAAAERLPVYRLDAPKATSDRAAALLANVLGAGQGSTVSNRERIIRRSGNKTAEIYQASGGVWLADNDRLWNPALTPGLPSADQAKALADEVLRKNLLLPARDGVVEVSLSGIGGSGAATEDPSGRVVSERQLDVQVNYSAGLNLFGDGSVVPVVGGGGEFSIAFGDGGSVVNYVGTWRPIAGVAEMAEVLPQEKADKLFKSKTKKLDITRVRSHLAYYAAPAWKKQEFLAPVWVYSATAKIGGQQVPLRTMLIAATDYGPFPTKVKKQKKRSSKAVPLPGTLEPEPESEKLRGGLAGLLRNVTDLLFSPRQAFAEFFEGGTSWIGPSQGLGGSPANAQGFVDGLDDAGWAINFNWGELNAWESDWRSNDDSWVDATDFVFYTGHANMNGWVLNQPSDTGFNTPEAGASPANPGDLWGQQDLEWVIIAACGPHQHASFVAGGGNAFDRWRGVFDGLHLFLGYGAVTYDNEEEGERVIEYARDGETIQDAWFRAAKEIQPHTNGEAAPNGPNVYVTVMWAHKASADPIDDHLWGEGSVSADPVAPNSRTLMWAQT
jgi:hypothetical protein